MNRLSAAAYTSSGTSHYFYKVIMYFPFVDTVQKPGTRKAAPKTTRTQTEKKTSGKAARRTSKNK